MTAFSALEAPDTAGRVRRLPTALAAVAVASALLAAADVRAVDAPKPAAVSTLMSHDLTGLPGKEAVMLTVEYPPGGSSPPHRHDANVFVYVLEGAINMQIEGQKQVTLTAGQTF